jgi:hypothetical protein
VIALHQGCSSCPEFYADTRGHASNFGMPVRLRVILRWFWITPRSQAGLDAFQFLATELPLLIKSLIHFNIFLRLHWPVAPVPPARHACNQQSTDQESGHGAQAGQECFGRHSGKNGPVSKRSALPGVKHGLTGRSGHRSPCPPRFPPHPRQAGRVPLVFYYSARSPDERKILIAMLLRQPCMFHKGRIEGRSQIQGSGDRGQGTETE